VRERGSPGFLDTSIIVRYMTGDPPQMAEQAARLLDSEETLHLSEIALLETAYVLSSFYKVPRPALVDALVALVEKPNLLLTTLPKARVVEALRLCRESKRYSFADAMLWAQARELEVGRIYSFDGRFPNQGVEVVRPERATS
jgi:predicted nucleic acid-binding protein